MNLNVNTSLLSVWLLNLATLVGSGFAVFGDPSLGVLAKAVIGGLAPLVVMVLTYSTHKTQQAKIHASAATTPAYLPSPTA